MTASVYQRSPMRLVLPAGAREQPMGRSAGEPPGGEEVVDDGRPGRQVPAVRGDPAVVVTGLLVAGAAVAEQGDDGAGATLGEHLRDQPERSPQVRAGGTAGPPAGLAPQVAGG